MTEMALLGGAVLGLYVVMVYLCDAIATVWPRLHDRRRAITALARQTRYRELAQRPQWFSGRSPVWTPPSAIRRRSDQMVAHWRAQRFFRQVPYTVDHRPGLLDSKAVVRILARFPEATVRLINDNGTVRWAVSR